MKRKEEKKKVTSSITENYRQISIDRRSTI